MYNLVTRIHLKYKMTTYTYYLVSGLSELPDLTDDKEVEKVAQKILSDDYSLARICKTPESLWSESYDTKRNSWHEWRAILDVLTGEDFADEIASEQAEKILLKLQHAT